MINIEPTQKVSDLIHQYPALTSFNTDDVVAMQRRWRDEWSDKKRQFGLYQGKGGFRISDDWEINEEEFLGLEDKS